jgi:hypothetical protein
MRMDNYKSQHSPFKRFLGLLAVVLLAGFTGMAGGQGPRPAPAPSHRPKTAKPGGKKATLPELYAMFFSFAAHVEARSIADTERGRDMKFYRAHLQKAAGLTPEEYAKVLEAAQRFAAADASVRNEIADEMKQRKQSAPSPLSKSQIAEYGAKMNSLMTQRASSLNSEIANVREGLGAERAKVFEAYLQTQYRPERLGTTLPPQKMLTPKQGSSGAQPDTISFNSGDSCSDDFDLYDDDDDYFGYWNICADAQISYISGDEVELYASISWDTGNVDGDWEITYYDTEGDLYVDGVYHPANGCDEEATSCSSDVDLTSGSGVSYDWNSTGTVTLDFDDECDDYCYEDTEDYTSDDASVVIYYPDINSLSKDTFNQGQSGAFTIDGEYLESAFENPPTVTVSNSSIFTEFEVSPPSSYPDGDITVTYTVSADAPTGEFSFTVNNGFGSDSIDFTVEAPPPPPTITSIAVNDVVGAPLEADTTQTVTLTGTNFGTSDQIAVVADSQYITVDSVGSPSITRSQAVSPGPPGSRGPKGAKPQDTQTLSFTVTTSADAPSGTGDFELETNDGASDPNVDTPNVTVDPIVLPNPQIWMLTSAGAACPSGTEVDGQTTPVYAGQPMFLCSPAPTLPTGVSVTSSAWTVPPPNSVSDLTGGFSTSVNSGGELPNPVMTNVSTLSFYWVVPDNLETMTYTYCVNDSTTQCATSAVASFDVSGPTGNVLPNAFLQTNNTATSITYPQTGSAVLQMTNAPGGAQFNPVPGVWFNDNATLPQNGQFIWVQILKSVTYSQLVAVGSTYPLPAPAANQLDGNYPYPSTRGGSLSSDAPSMNLYSQMGEGTDAFDAIMYVLWDPAIPPAGQTTCTPASINTSTTPYTPVASTCASIPIPLASVEWEWSACGINSGAGASPSWFAQCGPGYGAAPAASGYPQWNSCYVSTYGGCTNPH